MTDILWTPSPHRRRQSEMTRFINLVKAKRPIETYDDLYQWSIDDLEGFWDSVWDFCEIQASIKGSRTLINPLDLPQALFFPEARLNYAENALRRRDDTPALIFWREDRQRRQMSWKDLYDLVSRLKAWLEDRGVAQGDRVAAVVPNIPETVAAMLATASLGAIWCSCSPDFGVAGIIERFGQISAKVLITTDGYLYNGVSYDCLSKIGQALPSLSTVESVLVLSYLQHETRYDIPQAVSLEDAIKPYPPSPILFTQVPFNHPLWILFSSGTTGKPKCIVHKTGGPLLQLTKEHRLHCDIKPGDRAFYFTTCSWMMWNWVVTALCSEATVLLFDGSPMYEAEILFDFAQSERISFFGISPKYLDGCRKRGLEPIKSHRLPDLRCIASTGSPLMPEAFDYVYQSVKEDVHLASISGGTDIVSCFISGNPLAPVRRGEMQTPALGMAVQVFNDKGQPVREEKGELVCVKPFPTIPLGFWNDPQNQAYLKAYFQKYSNIWHHGDYLSITKTNGLVIYGRSDAVLNPGGVRIGTAEIYRQVESFAEILDSIAIAQEWDDDTRIILFVHLTPGASLSEELVARIKKRIRDACTPRHVPAKILQVSDVPRTKSGKLVELAVRDIVHGRPLVNQQALDNPEVLDEFRNRPELMT